jgi:hypothetical protein
MNEDEKYWAIKKGYLAGTTLKKVIEKIEKLEKQFVRLESFVLKDLQDIIKKIERQVNGLIEYISNTDINIHQELWKDVAEIKETVWNVCNLLQDPHPVGNIYKEFRILRKKLSGEKETEGNVHGSCRRGKVSVPTPSIAIDSKPENNFGIPEVKNLTSEEIAKMIEEDEPTDLKLGYQYWEKLEKIREQEIKEKENELITEFLQDLKDVYKSPQLDGCGYEIPDGYDVDYDEIRDIIEKWETKLNE